MLLLRKQMHKMVSPRTPTDPTVKQPLTNEPSALFFPFYFEISFDTDRVSG